MSTLIQCDNNITIKLSRNSIFHGRSKHIDIRFYFLRDLTKDKVIKLSYYNSQGCRYNNKVSQVRTVFGITRYVKNS